MGKIEERIELVRRATVSVTAESLIESRRVDQICQKVYGQTPRWIFTDSGGGPSGSASFIVELPNEEK